MKITKGQLKRIIAEEHQVVFGKKPASRKRTRRLTAKQRRIVEAKKKQAILREVKINYACNEVIEEGLGSFIRKLGGFAAKGAKKVADAYKDSKDAWDEVSSKVELEDAAKEAAEKALKAKAIEESEKMMNMIKEMPEIKAALEKLGDDKDAIQKVYASAIAVYKGMLAMPEPKEADA